MKKVLIVLVLTVLAVSAKADPKYGISHVYGDYCYVANNTFASVELSSTTLPFAITGMSFACEGNYATITSSISLTTADVIYVKPSFGWTSQKIGMGYDMRGTSTKIKINIIPDTTVYYCIEGYK